MNNILQKFFNELEKSDRMSLNGKFMSSDFWYNSKAFLDMINEEPLEEDECMEDIVLEHLWVDERGQRYEYSVSREQLLGLEETVRGWKIPENMDNWDCEVEFFVDTHVRCLHEANL